MAVFSLPTPDDIFVKTVLTISAVRETRCSFLRHSANYQHPEPASQFVRVSPSRRHTSSSTHASAAGKAESIPNTSNKTYLRTGEVFAPGDRRKPSQEMPCAQPPSSLALAKQNYLPMLQIDGCNHRDDGGAWRQTPPPQREARKSYTGRRTEYNTRVEYFLNHATDSLIYASAWTHIDIRNGFYP